MHRLSWLLLHNIFMLGVWEYWILQWVCFGGNLKVLEDVLLGLSRGIMETQQLVLLLVVTTVASQITL